jgi:dihydrofolate reductase
MRKIFSFIAISVDGYFSGPKGELDWHVVDGEFNEFAAEQIATIDTMAFGRVTYEGMASYWPTEEARHDDPQIAALMNDTPKLVFSRTLEKAGWENTRVIGDGLAEELTRLKAEPGKDIIVFGSSALTVSLLREGLLDELRLMVMPVALGGGVPVLGTATEPIPLELVSTRAFKSGNVLHTYRPAAR